MVLSEAGLANYNQRAGEQLSIDRFRANFIVAGCPAFDEDTWAEIWIGDLKFSNHKPCQRSSQATRAKLLLIDAIQTEPHPTNRVVQFKIATMTFDELVANM